MNINLTEEQVETIALAWIREKADYKKVLDNLFAYSTCAWSWAWSDALRYAVSLCSKNFCTKYSDIVKDL